MSTKIPTAFRIERAKMWDFCDQFDALVGSRLDEWSRMFMSKMAGGIIKKRGQEWAEQHGNPKKPPENHIVRAANLFSLFIQHGERGLTGLNADSSFNLWPNPFSSDDVLVIPYVPSPVRISSEDFPDWCEDYCYWDNVDPPDVDPMDWDHRGRVWESICDDWDHLRFSHVLFEIRRGIGVGKERLAGLLLGDTDIQAIQRVLVIADDFMKGRDRDERP